MNEKKLSFISTVNFIEQESDGSRLSQKHIHAMFVSLKEGETGLRCEVPLVHIGPD